MDDRNNVQLAIGYGLGAGMVLAGVLVVAYWFVGWVFGIDIGAWIVGAVFIVGGAAIAAFNAFRMDRETVSEIEDRDE